MSEAWKDAASAAMDRYACGDDDAFSDVYDHLAPRLSAFLSRRTRDADRTQDLVQQTFLQMHCARRHFSPGADVVPWAFAIARRLLIDAARKSGREVVADDADAEPTESPAPDASPEQLTARRRLARRVEEALAGVPHGQRLAFELVQCDGLSMAEAAEVLGTTVAAVKLRAFRTYEALRAMLGEQAHEELGGAP